MSNFGNSSVMRCRRSLRKTWCWKEGLVPAGCFAPLRNPSSCAHSILLCFFTLATALLTSSLEPVIN